jgi:hypothetical protein
MISRAVMKYLRVDVPVTSAVDDRLERGALIDRLVDILVEGRGESRRATRVVAGLTGTWGAGKSSVMGRLRQRLASMANVIVVDFNPWVVGHTEENLRSFLDTLGAAIRATCIDDGNDLANAFYNYREALEPTLKDISPMTSKFFGVLPKRRARSLIETRAKLEQKLESIHAAVVILIDELDRVDDSDVREMARSVKAIGDLPNISYLIAFDRARVESALGLHGSDYIKKIVQFTISLRPLMDYEARALLVEQLEDRGYKPDLGDTDLFEELMVSILPTLKSPRDIKWIVGGFSAIEPTIRGEVNSVDLFAYALLSAQAPSFRDFLEYNSEYVVNDPISVGEYMRRSKGSRAEVFGQVYDALASTQLNPVIEFLFPVVSEKRRDTERFGRLQDRNNLMTALYLGDPPFRLSKKQILEFWGGPTSDKLKSLEDKGVLEDLILQIASAVEGPKPKADRAAWKSIVTFLGARETILNGTMADLVHVATSAIIQIAQKDPARAERIFVALRTAKDLVIAPSLVRYHMFAHGLIKGQAPRGGPVMFDKTVTMKILIDEVTRYRTALSKRSWMAKGASVDFFFAMEQSNQFKDKRAKFSAQLHSKAAAILFAAIMTPSTSGYEPGVLLKFLDPSILLPHLKMMMPPEDAREARSLELLSTRLEGDEKASLEPKSEKERVDEEERGISRRSESE